MARDLDVDFDADDYENQFGGDDSYPHPRETRCRHCGSADVYWGQTPRGKWVLCNLDSKMHKCDTNTVSQARRDAFDDITGGDHG